MEKIVFYLFIFFLPTQFGKHFWPPFSQVLGIRVDYLSPTLYVTDLLIFLLFSIWLKRQKKLSLRGAERRSNPVRDKIVALSSSAGSLACLIFLLYLLLNTFFSNNPLLSLYGLVKTLELFFLGFYISQNIKSKIELATIGAIFSVSVIGESLLAITQYLHQGSINGLLYYLGERKFTSVTPGIANASINGALILRPYGTFPHPNVLAGFLLCALIFIFAWFEDKKDFKKKMLKATALLLGSIALFLTLSRVAIILWTFLLIAIAVIKLISQKHKKKSALVYSSAFFALVIFISLLFFTPVLSRLKGTRLTDEAITQRMELLQSTLSLIMSSPLLGAGLYNFLPALSHVQKPLSPTLYLQPVHNIFLLVAAEMGIIGLAFFLWFLFRTYARLVYMPDNIRNALLVLVSVILTLGLFDHYWLTLQQGQLLFALVLGLCWAF